MSNVESGPAGPDFADGLPLTDIVDGAMISGHVAGTPALLVKQGGALFIIGSTCTHYGAPLADGLLVGETIRCPWHHACFNLRTGAVLRAPALHDLPCWRVAQRDGRAFAEEMVYPGHPAVLDQGGLPSSVIIIGGGAAGNAAAETLRREGYAGPITLVSADPALPYDRPNLSKDYLAGSAPADWLPLRSAEFYKDQRIDVRCDTRAVGLDTHGKVVTLADGSRLDYGALLLATGAQPIHLTIPGGSLPHVHVLRTLADCDALLAEFPGARRCVVVGASFIGLEAAAALRTRGLAVSIVAPGAKPLARIFGPAISAMIQALHEHHGVRFHLGSTLTDIEPGSVTLSSGERLDADLVVVGIGVQPAVELAQTAGLALDNGILVDSRLRTSATDVFAAGDIARWPDRRTGAGIRIEHWVVAERQGVAAARNMLGRAERFDAVPFFWTQQYDVTINYVGHAEQWDRLEIKGDPATRNCKITYWRGATALAVATIGRDLDSLRAELAFESALA